MALGKATFVYTGVTAANAKYKKKGSGKVTTRRGFANRRHQHLQAVQKLKSQLAALRQIERETGIKQKHPPAQY